MKITEFALGSDYPILHSVRVRPTEDLSSMVRSVGLGLKGDVFE